MGKLTGILNRFTDIFRGGRTKPRGFELSDEVKQEILSGLGQKPTDDLRWDRSELDKKPREEESDNS
jgi:hypothetical protein